MDMEAELDHLARLLGVDRRGAYRCCTGVAGHKFYCLSLVRRLAAERGIEFTQATRSTR